MPKSLAILWGTLVLSTSAAVADNVKVYFSPSGGCTEAVVAALDHATSSVFVQAYSFTSAPIARALIDAHKRGVETQVILDSSQRTEKYSEADFCAHAGIPTFIDAKHAIAHNKIIIIDARQVLTGSFNFTAAAEKHNAENLLVIDDPALAAKYTQNWTAHLKHSEPYGAPVSGPNLLLPDLIWWVSGLAASAVAFFYIIRKRSASQKRVSH